MQNQIILYLRLRFNESEIEVLESGFSFALSDYNDTESSIIAFDSTRWQDIEIWFNGQNKTGLFDTTNYFF